MSNRAGRILINRNYIIDKPELVLAILRNVIIFRAETLYYNNEIEYRGFSELFDEVPETCEMPTYKVICKTIDVIQPDEETIYIDEFERFEKV